MKRENKVAYKHSNLSKVPMIRIANKYLTENGFGIGDKIEVDYRQNKIVIKKNEKGKTAN